MFVRNFSVFKYTRWFLLKFRKCKRENNVNIDISPKNSSICKHSIWNLYNFKCDASKLLHKQSNHFIISRCILIRLQKYFCYIYESIIFANFRSWKRETLVRRFDLLRSFHVFVIHTQLPEKMAKIMDFKVFRNKKKNTFTFVFGNTRLSNVPHMPTYRVQRVSLIIQWPHEPNATVA